MTEHWTVAVKKDLQKANLEIDSLVAQLDETKETIKGLQDELAAEREKTITYKHGEIAEVSVTDRCLSPEEIRQRYADKADPVAPYVEALRPFAQRTVLEVAKRRNLKAVDFGVGVADLARAVDLVDKYDRKE